MPCGPPQLFLLQPDISAFLNDFDAQAHSYLIVNSMTVDFVSFISSGNQRQRAVRQQDDEGGI
jgi:hypothetical protein